MKNFLLKLRSDKAHYLFFAVSISFFIFLNFWKIKYGFKGWDESFYITIPHRILQGDALFKDEWHLSQLSGFLRIPFVWIYELVTKSTEGIVLFIRVCYVVFHAVVSVFAYIRLRKYGYVAAVSMLLYFIFTPFDIMALSYNTMGMDFLVVTGVTMATADTSKKLPFILSGISFSAVVLCCPFMALVYVLFAFGVLSNKIFVEKKRSKIICSSFLAEDIFSTKVFLYFSLGVAISAAVFLSFVLSRTSIGDIIENIPYLLSDPEHPNMTIAERFAFTAYRTITFHDLILIPIISFIILLIVIAFDRKRISHRVVYLAIGVFISLLTEFLYKDWVLWMYHNAIMSPAFFMGTVSYLLLKNKPAKLFAGIFLAGTFYAFLMSFSSNNHIFIIVMGLCVPNIASFIFTYLLAAEIYKESNPKKIVKSLKIIVISLFVFYTCFQGLLETYVKIYHCYGEDGNTLTLNYMIDKGPAKGIYTNEENYNHYNALYDDVVMYNNHEGKKVLFVTQSTWTYLAAYKTHNAALSAWLWIYFYDECFERMRDYYSVNEDKIPDYIYIEKSTFNLSDKASLFDELEKNGYEMTENDISYMFAKK